MSKINLRNTTEQWIDELDKYNTKELAMKQSPTEWSMGQLFMHLVESTNHFLKEIETCFATNENSEKEMYESAKVMFQNNAFPDMKLKGPSSNDDTPNPSTKEQISESFKELIKRIIDIEKELEQNVNIGKTRHPGQNYLNANEWYIYADMHMRHHWRQKKRIDNFLKLK